MTTAFTVFAKAVVRQGKIPFEISADPFYSEANQARLLNSIADLQAGKGIVTKTMEDLEAFENE